MLIDEFGMARGMSRDKSYGEIGRMLERRWKAVKKAPSIVLVMSKEDLLSYISDNNADISLYGCPSGSTYSNCRNS